MGGSIVSGSGATTERARIELSERLEARRAEIEGAALTRLHAISDPAEAADPTYADGLRVALTAAIDYGFAGVRSGEERPPAIPVVLLTQARMAARNRVSLDTVLRRYFAGYSLLGDYLMAEAERGGLLQGAALKRLLRSQAALFDRLIAAVSEEHAREAGSRRDTAEQRRAERIDRLLAGELVDVSELSYEFEAHHVGLIAHGPKAQEAVRELAEALDRRPLAIRRDDRSVWAWLGGRHPVGVDNLERILAAQPGPVFAALGEPAQGLSGWRLTHRQAKAALPIALRGRKRVVRYADTALLASVLQDDLLSTSLCQLYLAPLMQDRDGGEVLRETLRTYFVSERNTSSTAAALGVSRQTVVNRLHAAEERLGRPIAGNAAEIEAALRLEDLGQGLVSHTALKSA